MGVVWVDNKDGTNRKKRVKSRRGGKTPPRPVPKAVREYKAKPAKFGRYRGEFTRVEAKRLLDRAGFGPRPGEADKLARMGLKKAVRYLTRPKGKEKLIGPAPKDEDGNPIAPFDAWGHDHLWWLDRMVRTNQPFRERMTLIFHDWFATSNSDVGRPDLMIQQNALLRSMCLSSFKQMLVELTRDPAMLDWLDGIDNTRRHPNENYARELMELFTLGADRGAYTEDDVREMARVLTGFRADWTDDVGYTNFRYDPNRHDTGAKTVFGKSGNFEWHDALTLVTDHPLHASFFVEKLWSYFIPTPPHANTRQKLAEIYKGSGFQILPVVEAILMHPDFYRGARMVKPPVVHLASMLRAKKKAINTEAYTWLAEEAGQFLFYPPNVAGWDDTRWLDTSTLKARWHFFTYIQYSGGTEVEVWPENERKAYSTRETPTQAVNNALKFWGWPPMTDRHRKELIRFARVSVPRRLEEWEEAPYRAMRQNALRHLISVSPDMMLQ